MKVTPGKCVFADFWAEHLSTDSLFIQIVFPQQREQLSWLYRSTIAGQERWREERERKHTPPTRFTRLLCHKHLLLQSVQLPLPLSLHGWEGRDEVWSVILKWHAPWFGRWMSKCEWPTEIRLKAYQHYAVWRIVVIRSPGRCCCYSCQQLQHGADFTQRKTKAAEKDDGLQQEVVAVGCFGTS